MILNEIRQLNEMPGYDPRNPPKPKNHDGAVEKLFELVGKNIPYESGGSTLGALGAIMDACLKDGCLKRSDESEIIRIYHGK